MQRTWNLGLALKKAGCRKPDKSGEAKQRQGGVGTVGEERGDQLDKNRKSWLRLDMLGRVR